MLWKRKRHRVLKIYYIKEIKQKQDKMLLQVDDDGPAAPTPKGHGRSHRLPLGAPG
jgi:hypothetical protein